jgi:phosphatidylserine/phosphatidylglycerophosphate/cardiolipin synthase-like enzyme
MTEFVMLWSWSLRMDIISLIGLILTIVALALALFQQRSANAHAKGLKEIRHSMSTQFIGLFPEFIPDVVRLIQSAKQEVLIAYGQVTYGIFSYRQMWLEYKTALEHKLQDGVPVDLLCLDEKEREKHQKEQFYLASNSWEEAINDSQFKARLENFLHRFGGTTKEISWGRF